MSAALTVVATFCLHDAKGCMHFCWMLVPDNITLYGQIPVTSYVSESHCFEMTNSLRSNGWEMWNMLLRISRSLKRSASEPHVHGVLRWQDAAVGSVAHRKFWRSTEGGLLISGIRPAKSSCVVSLFLHKFKHFPDVRSYKTFYCFWSGLTVVLCSSLQTLPPLFMGNQGHRSGGFL